MFEMVAVADVDLSTLLGYALPQGVAGSRVD
jgi:hypothetical protein